MDERFIMHRLKSTRFALVGVAVMMGIYFEYEYIVRKQLHWDILIFLIAMAILKFGAMLYYRKFK